MFFLPLARSTHTSLCNSHTILRAENTRVMRQSRCNHETRLPPFEKNPAHSYTRFPRRLCECKMPCLAWSLALASSARSNARRRHGGPLHPNTIPSGMKLGPICRRRRRSWLRFRRLSRLRMMHLATLNTYKCWRCKTCSREACKSRENIRSYGARKKVETTKS